MELVYRRIAHGDEQHREWLRQKCIELEVDLEAFLKASNVRDSCYNDFVDIDMVDDPPN